MTTTSRRTILAGLALVAVGLPALQATVEPTGVSPGSATEVVTIASFCPTFSWSLAPDAEGYELVVVSLAEADAAEPIPSVDPLLRIDLPAGTGSWTPSGSHCLEQEHSYAWYVRAVLSGSPGSWSTGLAFHVAPSGAIGRLETLLERIEKLERERSAATATGPTMRPGQALPTISPTGAPVTVLETTHAAELTGSAAIRGELSATTGVVYGVLGVSNSTDEEAAGVAGEATATSGETLGVLGVVSSNAGTAVRGMNLATTASGTEAWATGVMGTSMSPQGVGVTGLCEADSGQNAGVAGIAASASGWGGFFVNEGGGSLLVATNDSSNLGTLEFEVENDGTTHIGAYLALKPFDTPTTCDISTEGWVYYDNSTNELCYCPGTGGSWLQVDSGGICG